jgi:hypothetical protein
MDFLIAFLPACGSIRTEGLNLVLKNATPLHNIGIKFRIGNYLDTTAIAGDGASTASCEGLFGDESLIYALMIKISGHWPRIGDVGNIHKHCHGYEVFVSPE